jgi:hypothetical protein
MWSVWSLIARDSGAAHRALDRLLQRMQLGCAQYLRKEDAGGLEKPRTSERHLERAHSNLSETVGDIFKNRSLHTAEKFESDVEIVRISPSNTRRMLEVRTSEIGEKIS